MLDHCRIALFIMIMVHPLIFSNEETSDSGKEDAQQRRR